MPSTLILELSLCQINLAQVALLAPGQNRTSLLDLLEQILGQDFDAIVSKRVVGEVKLVDACLVERWCEMLNTSLSDIILAEIKVQNRPVPCKTISQDDETGVCKIGRL